MVARNRWVSCRESITDPSPQKVEGMAESYDTTDHSFARCFGVDCDRRGTCDDHLIQDSRVGALVPAAYFEAHQVARLRSVDCSGVPAEAAAVLRLQTSCIVVVRLVQHHVGRPIVVEGYRGKRRSSQERCYICGRMAGFDDYSVQGQIGCESMEEEMTHSALAMNRVSSFQVVCQATAHYGDVQ